MQAFVPKNRRVSFPPSQGEALKRLLDHALVDDEHQIIDLNNVPLSTGTSYVKWHLPSSNSAEHHGRTSKSNIRDHKVSWEYEKALQLRLVIDKHGTLQESDIHFEVLQEYSSGARGETIILGNVRLNLAEYVESSDEGVDGVIRRYLMQESKINSTLKIGIFMNQIEGDTNFVAPTLKIAPVFGGIAGIVAAEGEADDVGHIPSISTKTREINRLQDTYRQTLAASWAAQVGELPADKCIEEIFAGGDGWGGRGPNNNFGGDSNRSTQSLDANDSDGDQKTVRGPHHGRLSPTYRPSLHSHHRTNSREHSRRKSQSTVSGRGSIDQVQASGADSIMPDYERIRSHEVDEFAAREDLRSWEISAK